MTQDISPPTRDRVRKKHTGEPGNGGQFGHTGREPSGLNLSPQDTAHLQRLFDRADRSAAQLARKMRGGQGWDHEDLAQDVKMEIVARAKRAGRVDPRDMTEAWVHYFTNGIIARVAEVTRQGRSPAEHYRARHESMAAYREFTSTVTERERALGRALSRAEKDAIAAEIRDLWPDRNHRPPQGFHHTIGVFSSDRTAAVVATYVREPEAQIVPSAEETYLSTGGREWADVEDLPAVRQAVSAGSAAAAKKYAWRAVAQMNGLPDVTVRLNNRQIANVRTHVGSTKSDVLAVIDEFNRGQDTQRVQEFFRVFGADTPGHREQVVEVFQTHADRAEELFAAAVAGATARNFKGESA